MTRPMRVLALVLLGAAVPACTALAGLTDDYRLADAGGAGAGNADRDALSEGFVPGQDGGADALVDQLGTARYCDTVAKPFDFCNDFEDGDPAAVPPEWTGVANTLAASIKVVAGAGTNGSRVLDVDSTTSSTSSRNIILHKTLAAGKPNAGDYLRYEVEFDFQVLACPVGVNYLAVGVLSFTNATPEDHGIAVYTDEDLVARLTPKANGVSGALNRWHHARIVLEHPDAGTSFSRTVTVDGTIVDATTISSAGTSLTEIRIGIFYTTGGAGQIHAVFDNIVARRR